MARKFDIKSIVLGALLGAIVVFSVVAARTGKAAWDYKIISGSLVPYDQQHSLGPQLTQAAAGGWELVGPATDNGFLFLILRRAK